jgi:hypothetical protein
MIKETLIDEEINMCRQYIVDSFEHQRKNYDPKTTEELKEIHKQQLWNHYCYGCNGNDDVELYAVKLILEERGELDLDNELKEIEYITAFCEYIENHPLLILRH